MNLIIQSSQDIPPASRDCIASLSASNHIEQIAQYAYCLHDAQPHEGIQSYCHDHQLDYGFVRPNQRLSDIGLVVMDMDSTLITIECIDEIADMYNLKLQVSAITESSMRGEIEFAEGLRRRVALLAGLEVSAMQRVYDERLLLSPGADILMSKLKKMGVKTMLLSGGFVFFTERLKVRLGFDYAYANSLEISNGKISGKLDGEILDAQGKADWLTRVRDQLSLEPDQVIAIGDGANDLEMMAQAGVSIAYHAKPAVRRKADYALNFTGLDGVLNLFAN